MMDEVLWWTGLLVYALGGALLLGWSIDHVLTYWLRTTKTLVLVAEFYIASLKRKFRKK